MDAAASASADNLYRIRHSLAHVLAQAVLELRPQSKLAFGPPIDDGFYYDFDLTAPLTPEDFPEIEKKMHRIIAEKQPFTTLARSIPESIKLLQAAGEVYKVEYAEELASRGETELGFYKNGPFEDMCRGPHVTDTGKLPTDCFKIDSLAGAYWRGDEKRPQLTRIYAVAFENKQQLEEYLERRRLAEERDHRKLGTELDLFSINHEEVGGGLILWHPKGGMIRHLIEQHCKKRHIEGGYDFVYTPHIGRSTLWETSGHLDFYKDGMFPSLEMEGQEFYLKPMNCPFHCHIYKSSLRSYRELPKRFAEWGTVYRYEKSGSLQGLLRVRGFTQDDAHLFCREDQMPGEIDKVLDFSLSILRDFSFQDFILYLSTRPEKRVGDESKWDAAEDALRSALERSGIPFQINAGDGAFYGPKIDICVNDALGRKWQLSTIQFDFNLPERFDLSYTGTDGHKHRPYMIHRALLGSMERFFAVLIEHLGGAFPTWLAPVQAKIVVVSEKFMSYGEELKKLLSDSGLRVEIDSSTETLNKRIRSAVTQKIPNVLVVGGKEMEARTVTVRRYGVEAQETLSIEDFVKSVQDRVSNRT
jgi:threonyl-tRNA synthetase